ARQKLGAPVEFTGYDVETDRSAVALLARGGEFVNELREGDEGVIYTRKTPFYGESGGQVGDRGVIRAGDALFRVTDTQKPLEGLIVHVGRVEKGSIAVGEEV